MGKNITVIMSGIVLGIVGYFIKTKGLKSEKKNAKKMSKEIISHLAKKTNNMRELDNAVYEAEMVAKVLEKYFKYIDEDIAGKETKKGRTKEIDEAKIISKITTDIIKEKRAEGAR